ncbi:MAG: hypothetical protein AAF909_07910 [Pseudomonadota bacterium]
MSLTIGAPRESPPSEGPPGGSPPRAARRSGRWGALLRGTLGWIAGAALCLSALTAALAQGWLQTRARAWAGAAARRRDAAPAWAVEGAPRGVASAAVRIASEGAQASAALFLGALPFTALMLGSWWAGWENSFNKGYEQSWVGPSLGLLAAALALPLLARMPLALTHLAVERRFGAFFERRAVGRLMAAAGWEHVALSAAFVIAALPLLAAKGLPVFVEQISPDLDLTDPEAVAAFTRGWRLGAALYLFAALWALRCWTARLYARARLRVEQGAPTRLIGRLLRTALCWAVWFGLVAQIYVGQFFNHRWVDWLNPPLLGLPVAPVLG